MIKRYSIQFSGVNPIDFDFSKWSQLFNVQIIEKSLSENIIWIECEEKDLSIFLEKLNFVKLT